VGYVQQGAEFELVTIDGASTDGTLNVLDGYRYKISVFVSESDNGMYRDFDN